MGDDIGQRNTALEKQKQLLLSQEYVGDELELVDFGSLISARSLLPRRDGAAYDVNEKVGIEGDYYIYNIHTPHATYMCKGTHALVQYAYESEIIEMFLNSKHSEQIVDGVGEYFTQSLKGVGNLITHPVDSVKGIGRSFDVMAKSVGSDVKKELSSNAANKNRVDRDVLPGSSMYSRELLKIAFSLRTDAYTLNPHMQGLLTTLASKREIGRAFFSMVTWVIPGGSAFSVGQDVSAWGGKGLTAGGGSLEVETFISDYTPQDALIRIAGFYKEKMGLNIEKNSAVVSLLANTSYSPRQQAYIAYYLADLQKSGTAGILPVIGRFAQAGSVFEAIYNTIQLEMIHALHKEYSMVKQLILMREQVAVAVNAGQLIVMPLWDHTRQRTHVRDLLVETKNIAATTRIPAQVWFVGDCDNNVIKVANDAGIKVRYGVAADQTFRFTSYRKMSYKRNSNDPYLVDAGTVKADQGVRARRKPEIPSQTESPGQ